MNYTQWHVWWWFSFFREVGGTSRLIGGSCLAFPLLSSPFLAKVKPEQNEQVKFSHVLSMPTAQTERELEDPEPGKEKTSGGSFQLQHNGLVQT